jgi:hypothetical protein
VKEVVAYFKVLSRHLCSGKTARNLSGYSVSGQIFEPGNSSNTKKYCNYLAMKQTAKEFILLS